MISLDVNQLQEEEESIQDEGNEEENQGAYFKPIRWEDVLCHLNPN